ncbi:MAG: protein-disulfide reductase DsbD family protein [Bdellovibrionales bacterium]
MTILRGLFRFLPLLFVAWPLNGLAQQQDPLKVESQLLPARIKPHQPVKLILQLKLPPTYHAYADQFAIRVEPTSGFQLGDWSVGPLKKWQDKFSRKEREGVHGSGQLVAELIAPENFETTELKFELDYQACGETFCLFPITQRHKVSFATQQISSSPPMMGWDLQKLFKRSLEKSLWLAFLLAFVAGFMTSLTPCVYPMIPITLAVLTRGAENRRQWDQFQYSLIYVFGIATTFSLLGLAAAQFGFLFGSLLNQIWILLLISMVLLAMGLSLIGVFEVQLPMVFMNFAAKQYASGRSGAFISGLFFGVIASPCVGPVLVAILAWVSSTQSPWLGFSLLFIYALGLGVLFIALGFFSKILPRSGAWMVGVKKLMGMFVLAVSAYYGVLIWQQAQFFQTPTLNEDLLKEQALPWKPLTTEALSKARGKPVMIDFWALWCAACHELEQFTFTDPRIQKESEKFFLFKYDATQVTPETQKWMEKFSIRGLPAVIFLSSDGQWLEDLTLNEYEEADPFLVRMQKAQKSGPLTQ